MKCNQSRPGFELVSPCSFPTTITITPQEHPLHYERHKSKWNVVQNLNIVAHGSAQVIQQFSPSVEKG